MWKGQEHKEKHSEEEAGGPGIIEDFTPGGQIYWTHNSNFDLTETCNYKAKRQ